MNLQRPQSEPFHIVLVHPEIPQNTGNIGRTCVALGAKLWLVRPLGFRLDASRLRRAGMDYWEALDWEAVDGWEQLEAALAGRSMWFFSKTADRSYTDATYSAGDVLVFGSETQGLPTTLRQPSAAHVVRIPMRKRARSLNLASSVAIAAYEAERQRSAAETQA